MKTFTLGIDIGSISLKTAVLNSDRETVHSSYSYTEAQPRKKLLEALNAIRRELGNITFHGIVCTGSGKKLFTEKCGLAGLNEIVAHARSCWETIPDVRSLVEIGGQDSKFITIGRWKNGTPYVEDFSFNGLCSAGTGAFLDQQSERLGLAIEDFAELAHTAESVPAIAGRCSVFAKSDMIHLQQKGSGKDAIAAGLCFSLARNYLATLCRGKIPEGPVAFQGGVAANRGMLRAFSQIFNIPEESIIVPRHHKIAGAHGAALEAAENPLPGPRSVDALTESIKNIEELKKESDAHGILTPPDTDNRREARREIQRDTPLYMGLDIGSVTTKGVVITEDGDIAARASEPTRSDPVSASSRVLDRLGHELQKRGVNSLPAGFYTTGSGRRLVQEIFRADEAVDEITAHARSATFYHPEADTVFEIGGQDSKFIRIENGRVNSFIMNRLCAAGTGSFLEEQAVRLNVDIETQFSDYAFRSAAPSRLGIRCTVFMDSDLVHHIQKGESTEDLCAGLAYSIVENYLHNVSADPGEHIIFQGGVAINRAVHAAFEAKLGRPINLHPAPIYAGAVGAALVARDSAPDGKTRFPGFSSERESYTTEYRTCTGCANRCDIMTVTSAGGKRLSFGSICGKHGASPVRSRTTIPGYGKAPMDRYQELLYADYLTEVSGDNRKTGKDRGTVALPSGLTLYQDYPFWAAFFTSLGFTPVSTGDGDESTAAEGKEKLPVETCMPMRMLFGHALQADRLKTDYIFVPHTPGVKQHEEEAPRYLCPYTQTAGYLIRKAVTADTIILDRPVQGERTSWLYRASRTLAISRNDIADALSRAEYAEELFLKKCREEGKQILEALGTAEMQGLVLIGRPYVIHDMYLNNQAALRIEETGMVPMPAEFLDTRGEDIGVFWDRVHWSMGRQMLKAASFTRKHPQLHPLLMTSFGCGPDGFLIPFLEEMLKGSPRLVLEFDENRIDTGMITRIEAYIRSLGNYSRGHNSRRRHTVWRPSPPLADYECFIPRFSDHAYAYAGALRAAGCSAEVLPPTDDRSIDLARKQVNGNECHPFLTILGDLLRLAETRDGRASREAIYYAPSYVGSCLINAYETSMQITLDNQGIEDLHLLDFGNMQLMKELGLIYPYYLAMASYAIDRLTKWAHEIVPYENQRGSVLATHRHNMERLLVRMSERKIMKGIREAVERMKNVAVGSPPGTTGTEAHRGRTALGVVGDVFTRINPAANFSLFDKIRDSGFDVYASALIMDVVLYRYEQLYRRLSDDGKKIAGGAAKALLPAISILKRRVDRLFPDTIRTPQESSFPEVNGRTARFIDYRVDNLISLNINRIYELSDAGARGILNVMCPNCMIGTMSEAFFPDIKEDLPHLPVVSLSFGDQQETHVDNRLEAFLHLVRENSTHQRDDCLE